MIENLCFSNFGGVDLIIKGFKNKIKLESFNLTLFNDWLRKLNRNHFTSNLSIPFFGLLKPRNSFSIYAVPIGAFNKRRITT